MGTAYADDSEPFALRSLVRSALFMVCIIHTDMGVLKPIRVPLPETAVGYAPVMTVFWKPPSVPGAAIFAVWDGTTFGDVTQTAFPDGRGRVPSSRVAQTISRPLAPMSGPEPKARSTWKPGPGSIMPGSCWRKGA
jgi:hypothetical protein